MNNQEILDNGPEGWTHFCEKNKTYHKFVLGKWFNCMSRERTSKEGALGFRIRSDIERIVELEEVISRLRLGDWTPEEYHLIAKSKAGRDIKADAIEIVADKFNSTFVNEKVTNIIPPEQFIWWNRVYGELKNEVNKLRETSKNEA